MGMEEGKKKGRIPDRLFSRRPIIQNDLKTNRPPVEFRRSPLCGSHESGIEINRLGSNGTISSSNK